jgi:chromosome segregation ATPase
MVADPQPEDGLTELTIGYVEELLAEVERLTEALETVIRENAAGYDNLKRRLEQLREERDRLAAVIKEQADEIADLYLKLLPVREDTE